MRVLIVNTSERTGGAAIAASRLAKALINNGVQAKMLVVEKNTDHLYVATVGGWFRKTWSFVYERFVIWLNNLFSRKNLFAVSIANTGIDITKTPEFKEADVIHLHWINQGMLSLRGIRRILDSGKPVVWTMHDLWPATAICHYPERCERFKSHCRECGMLHKGGCLGDLAARVWKRKKAMLASRSISFVACSRWLCSEARQSALLKEQRIVSIPNPIDTRIFHPVDKVEARKQLQLPEDKQIILFVSQKVSDPRKGMDYLIESLNRLLADDPSLRERAVVAILGGQAEEIAERLPMEAYPLGYVSETKRIVTIYSAVDLFVTPSLSDNLPNTIMEAMACGVPCVGFKVGGIPEMIDHLKNGYVANYCDAADFANGIRWVLAGADWNELSAACLRKVHTCYSLTSVSLRYTELYSQALASKNYKI